MIIITKKISRGRLLAGCLALVLTVGVVGAGVGLVRNIREVQTVSAAPHQGTKGVKSNEQRIAFLEDLGWIVGTEAASIEDIQIPETFDASYDEYLALQESQWFHLQDFAGKKVKRYTYEVRNYPGLQEGIWASLLIYKKEVIGGEVFCSQGDGFMQSLDYPTGTKTSQTAVTPAGEAARKGSANQGGLEGAQAEDAAAPAEDSAGKAEDGQANETAAPAEDAAGKTEGGSGQDAASDSPAAAMNDSYL